MKKKLTVTIDAELLPKAKRYARARGLSLSQIIENSLRELSSGECGSFSQRWRGRFSAADRQDERFKQLSKKYL